MYQCNNRVRILRAVIITVNQSINILLLIQHPFMGAIFMRINLQPILTRSKALCTLSGMYVPITWRTCVIWA